MEDCLNQQELCNRTFRDKPSTTRLIDNLEKQKLVKRIASKEDRRINIICLTDAAKNLQKLTINMANETMNEALAGVSKAEIETVKKVLYQVYDNLNKVSKLFRKQIVISISTYAISFSIIM
jgi:DNA-binding MarR family transcriptional regulator